MSVLLKIQLEGNQSKTLKFELKTTIAETIKTIETKTRIPHDPSFAIFVPSKNIWASDTDTLDKFGLENMASIEFKKRTAVGTSSGTMARSSSGTTTSPRVGSSSSSASPPTSSSISSSSDRLKRQTSFGKNNFMKILSAPGGLTASSKEDPKKAPSKSPRGQGSSISPGAQPNELVVKLDWPEEGTSRNMKIEPDLTVEDLMKSFFRKTHPYKEMEDYAFFITNNRSRTRLEPSRKVTSYNIETNDTLLFERFQIRVRVLRPSGEKTFFVEKPDCKVQELLSRAIGTISGAKVTDYHFFLPSKHSGGVKLDPGRTVLSYRMCDEDVLELKKNDDHVVSSKPEDEGALFLVVESPTHGVASTMPFTGNMTVAEAISRFTKKNPVSNASNYALFQVMPNGEHKKMESLFKLSNYQLKNKDKLVFKEVSTPATPNTIATAPSPAVDPTGVFGVDPSTLERTTDRGFTVPRCLVLMRKSIYRHKGLTEEGVFRIAGEDGINNDIKRQLNAKTYKDSDEVHALATLLKRWFGELPKRVFAGIPNQYFTEAAENDEKAILLPSKLSEPDKSYFLWFVELLLDVAFYSDVNKMSCANLAIVVGPILADINMADPIMSLTLTSKVVGTIQRYLSVFLKAKKEKGETPVVDNLDEEESPREAEPSGVPISVSTSSSSESISSMTTVSERPSPSTLDINFERVVAVATPVAVAVAEPEAREERLEKPPIEKERIERERLEKELAEKDRLEKEEKARLRIESEQAERERVERERAERERADRAEQERLEKLAREQALKAQSVEALQDRQEKIHARFTTIFSEGLYNLEEVLYMLDVLTDELNLNDNGLTITATGVDSLISLLADAGKSVDSLDLGVFEGGVEGGVAAFVDALKKNGLTLNKLRLPPPTAEEAASLVEMIQANPSIQISFTNATSYRLLGTALKEKGMATKAIEYYRIGMEHLRRLQQQTNT